MNSIERAELSLAGLSVGDALGERYFLPDATAVMVIEERAVPAETPWRYTDDTEMAISIVEVLRRHGCIDQDALAAGFAERFDPARGYGGAAYHLLRSIRDGAPWRESAAGLFGGQGSWGNGAAMRVAPVGAYFADDLDAAAEQAALSAVVTHTHPEGIAGGVAVSVAAALAWRSRVGGMDPPDFIHAVAERTPESETRDLIEKTLNVPTGEDSARVADVFGAGHQISALDTVPFVIWCAAHHLDSFEEAFWTTVRGLGDRDTTCAMVGGVVALSDTTKGIPEEWLARREPLGA